MTTFVGKNTQRKVLQPVSNQYNIAEKIKEANQKLFTSATTDPITQQRRQSSQRVRFKDKLVEYHAEESDKMTTDSGGGNQRIESVEEENFEEEDEESIEIENFDEKIEEISSELEDLKTNDSADAYDENDFELESHPINEQRESAAGIFDRVRKKRITNVVKVLSFGQSTQVNIGGRKTPQSESSEELQRLRVVKDCCQFKEKYKEALPRYNGFNSRYGLSKEEIERRESGRSQRKQDRNAKQMQELQQKEMVARVNEEVMSFKHILNILMSFDFSHRLSPNGCMRSCVILRISQTQ